jgi:hypothetical protein
MVGGALAAWEEKAKISEKALAMVNADLDVEQVKAEATQKEYLDKMLGEKKVELDKTERDLGLREAVLVEAWSQGLNPR